MTRVLSPGAASARGLAVLPRVRGRAGGIVHLGLSNFHRAHQAVYTARALDLEDGPWGIVGVARQSRDVLDAMTGQELSYCVVTLEGAATGLEVIRVHEDLLLAGADPEQVVDRLADPATKIITITVTEAGYTFDPRTGGLDPDRAELAADLAGRAPLTTVGQLAAALRRRHRAGGEPLTILSCDNLVRNGALTRSLMEEFLQRTVPEGEAAELLEWCRATSPPPDRWWTGSCRVRRTGTRRARCGRSLSTHPHPFHTPAPVGEGADAWEGCGCVDDAELLVGPSAGNASWTPPLRS